MEGRKEKNDTEVDRPFVFLTRGAMTDVRRIFDEVSKGPRRGVSAPLEGRRKITPWLIIPGRFAGR